MSRARSRSTGSPVALLSLAFGEIPCISHKSDHAIAVDSPIGAPFSQIPSRRIPFPGLGLGGGLAGESSLMLKKTHRGEIFVTGLVGPRAQNNGVDTRGVLRRTFDVGVVFSSTFFLFSLSSQLGTRGRFALPLCAGVPVGISEDFSLSSLR